MITPTVCICICMIYCRERLLSGKPHQLKTRAARILISLIQNTIWRFILDDLGWEVLEDRRMRQFGTLRYKITHDISPPYLRNNYWRMSLISALSLKKLNYYEAVSVKTARSISREKQFCLKLKQVKNFIDTITKKGLLSFTIIFWPRWRALSILSRHGQFARLENWTFGMFCEAIKCLICTICQWILYLFVGKHL